MVIHYLIIRLSKWARSQTVPSFMRNPANASKYVWWRERLCVSGGLWEITGKPCNEMNYSKSS